MNIVWNIRVATGLRIKVEFNDLKTQAGGDTCPSDYVEVWIFYVYLFIYTFM